MRIPLFLLATLTIASSAMAETVSFTHANLPGRHFAKGIGQPDTYDACIMLKNPAFKGAKIKSVSVPVPQTGGKAAPEATVWIATELPEKGDELMPVMSVATTITDYTISATFAEPYIIGDDPVYIGYTMTVEETVSNSSAFPIACVQARAEGGLYMRARSKATWSNYGTTNQSPACSLMTVCLEGDFPAANASMSLQNENPYSTPGGEATVNAVITNYGTQPIRTLTIDYLPQGATEAVPVNLTLDAPISALYGYSCPVSFTVPAGNETGTTEIALTLQEVNGLPNPGATVVPASLSVVPFIPKHRPVVEEYGGLWCSWCPAGYVAIEQGKYYFGDDFVPICFHNQDEMQMYTQLNPSKVDSYPSVFINRVKSNPLTAVEDWKLEAMKLAPASIELETAWSDENKNEISVAATVTFVHDQDNSNFAVSYALVADGLSDPEWTQRNEYWGDEGIGLETPYWDLFTKGTAGVKGLEYNDIVVYFPDPRGIEGSLPSTIKAEVPCKHYSTLDLSMAINKDRKQIWDKDKLRVIAVLCDPKSRLGFNAVSSAYSADFPVGLDVKEVMTEESPVVAIRYFDFQGRELSTRPVNMPFITLSIRENGTVTSAKHLCTK